MFADLTLADLTVDTLDHVPLGMPSEGTTLRLMWTIDGAPGELRIANLGQCIEQFEFADGTTLSRIELLQSDGVAYGARFIGTTNNDRIAGSAGVDCIDGSAGNDTMIGGAGDDIYWVDSASDVIVETAGGGLDKVQSLTIDLDLAHYANVEDALLSGAANLNLNGNAADNNLAGNSGSNTLSGGAGNDTLYGGAGIDTMVGGAGDDIYTVDVSGDVIVEAADEGIDKVISSTISLDLAAYPNVENAALTGTSNLNLTGNAGDNALTGNSGANVLTGGAGNDALNGGAGVDTMNGSAGDDTFTVDVTGDVIVEAADEGIDKVISSTISLDLTGYANVENATLTGTLNLNVTGNAAANSLIGNSGANVLTGGDGDDALNGGAGADTMSGGAGDDTFTVDVTGDVIVEAAGGGIDKVISSTISLDLTGYANVENATLSGTSSLNLTGNAGDNTLIGNSGANVLTGGGGNDVLNGGTGIDTMAGGSGDDTYYVDVVGDVVTESTGEGIDKVISSTIDLDLARYANVETAQLTGTGNLGLTGTENADTLVGNSGGNVLTGGGGNDTLSGGAGDDLLLGGSGNDRMLGGDGNDTIRGGAGSDTIYGQGGSDTYVLGIGDGQDTLVNQDGSSSLDVLLLEGFSKDNVWLAQKGDDLYVSIVGSAERMRVVGYYNDPTAVIDRIQLSGGQFIDGTQISSLVQAMASFSNVNTGLANTSITPSSIPTSVQTAIASSWHTS